MPSTQSYDDPWQHLEQPWSSHLYCDAFILDGHSYPNEPKRNLKVTSNRYRWGSSDDRGEGVTLLFFHGIGCHKELWQPVITRLFHLSSSSKHETGIREIWTFDRENHGDAAMLNREALKSWPPCLPINEWASTITDMVKMRLKGHRVVSIGHSAGSGVAMLVLKYAYDASIKVAATIIIEPTIFTREIFQETYEERITNIQMSEKVTLRRKDVWPNRGEAYNYMKKRAPWSTWDDTVLKLFTEHGLRSTGSDEAVTLKCPKSLESAVYADVEGLKQSATIFEELCTEVPIHVVWGGSHDFASFSPQLKQDLLRADSGRVPASVNIISGGGHMVPLQRPLSLAETVRSILDTLPSVQHSRISVKL